MRRIAVILSVAVVLVVILLLAGMTLLNVNRFRPRIEAELQTKLGRPVRLGELHLHLLPFSIKVDGLTVGESSAFPSSRPFATATEVYASAALMSLIHGQPQIRELTLQDPQIELIRNAAGIWNFSTLGNSSSGQPSTLNLDQLKVTNGQLAVTDQRSKSPRTVYNHIDLTLTGFAPGKQFDIDADAHLPGAGKELLTFKGKAGPLASGDAQAIPVEGHVSVQQVSLAGLNSIAAGTVPANTDAAVSGDTDVGSQSGTISCKGVLNLENATVRGAKVNYPINTTYNLSLNQKTDQIAVSSATVKMGPTAVSLSGTVDSGTTPAHLNVRVATNNASITELSRLASLLGVAFDQNDQVKGSISADLTATGPATALQIQGTLSSPNLQAQDIVLTNVHAACKMNNGVVELSPVTAGIFGGHEDGVITVNTKAAHPVCSAKTRFTGVDTNALLSAVSSMKNTLYGSLAADANLSFAIDAGANVARTLNGVLSFNITNGQLKNVNILNEVSKVGKFLNSAPAQAHGSDTRLDKLSGTLNIKDGVASTNNLIASMPEGSLSGTGSMNLVNQGIDMRVNAVLGSGVSKTVGGAGVGGFLNTALANNKGELVIPVLVTGTAAHPTFTPDVQAIAKMKMSHLLPTSGDPSKLASGLAGSVLGGVLGGQQSNQKNAQKQQQNPLGSILKGLDKK